MFKQLLRFKVKINELHVAISSLSSHQNQPYEVACSYLYYSWIALLAYFGKLDNECKYNLVEPEAFTDCLCENVRKIQEMQAERSQVSPEIPVQ